MLHKGSNSKFQQLFFLFQELELPFIKIAATEIVSGVSGNSEEKIRGLFDKAIVSCFPFMFLYY